MNVLNSVKNFFKKETVLCISGILALISCFFVPINEKYLSYIDVNTLILLFCLMLVMAGLQHIGFFSNMGNMFLKRIKSQRGLVLILISLCFFSSMLITNDVALITFVPFAILVLKMANMEYLVCLTITLMTISANLGSMLTPLGNPQNLYLYSTSNMSIGKFILITLPYTLISGILLFLCILFYKRRNVPQDFKYENNEIDYKKLIFYGVLFLICLLSVVGVLKENLLLLIILLAVFIANKKLILKVDYSLLLTFVFFFVFIGNMGNIEQFNNFINSIVSNREIGVSVIISQVISNVPCALLLSGFTDNFKALIIGTNLGGLGTLIASMASLISYKQIVTEYPTLKGKYIVLFTVFNIGFLAVLFLSTYFIK